LQSSALRSFTFNADMTLQEAGTGRVNFAVSTQGSAGSLVGYMNLKVNGTEYAVPYYATT
jgi:hypothetical protein